MNYIILSLIMLPILSISSLMMNQNHLLKILLTLEAMTLSTMLFITMTSMLNNTPMPSMSIMMLTFGACEASFGLALLVNMTRYSGSDMMNNMNLAKC
uniref:NADH dehydrogenase subunit 4L n=1 Tax=Acanthobdella peledina TaxID=60939 RepID=UPI002027D35C|nr:NADH dehydrogenase subunit 4L [Acanthobdella peledina]QYC97718.1 NADH dehydrogenase subunit 4L [Acanthobdella peledina]UZT67780.1 NADH dehydrogenase subunit 4L [Acanthobdella peledina]UZT67793.1 NADH dehydrogenase subunit 4L [Acanthobdella peledina]UZT67845.1 NADH dehydrogenase subunit 4L [Acanthobdella peledina]UZT67858.1 NADH dehydrogenase subunit 4L [Acanthobdella peledina]